MSARLSLLPTSARLSPNLGQGQAGLLKLKSLQVAERTSARRLFSSSSRADKQRLVILGSGWGGYEVLRKVNRSLYGQSCAVKWGGGSQPNADRLALCGRFANLVTKLIPHHRCDCCFSQHLLRLYSTPCLHRVSSLRTGLSPSSEAEAEADPCVRPVFVALPPQGRHARVPLSARAG